MMQFSDVSRNWRNEGNALYKRVLEGLAPVIARSILQKAKNAYYRAENCATNDDERASAQKNYAMSAFKMTQVTDDTSLVDFYYKEAMEYFIKADRNGRGHKSGDWLRHIQTKSLECWTSIRDSVENDDKEIRVKKYHMFAKCILHDDSKAKAYFELAEIYLHLAIEKLSKEHYKSALSFLKESFFPISEATRFAKTKSVKADIKIIQEDVRIQTGVAESHQALKIADDLLKFTVCEEEELNLDAIWDIMDWYRKAINLTRDYDIEMEAIAHSRIGYIYDKILKMRKRAKKYYTKCIELANSLVPRIVYEKEWYCLAATTLQQYQQDNLRKASEHTEEQKAAIKEKLKDKLDEIETKFTELSQAGFLEYIYKTFPPKNQTHKLGEIPEDKNHAAMTKLYFKAVCHYHPDKNDASVHGIEWKVLSEEIEKYLNNHYGALKSST